MVGNADDNKAVTNLYQLATGSKGTVALVHPGRVIPTIPL